MAKPEFKQPTVHSELQKVEARLALLEKEQLEPGEVDQKRQLKLTQKERGDVCQALKDPAIRRLMYRLLNLSGILRSSADPNPIITAHHEGMRSIGLEIYNIIKDADASAFYQMERDYESDKKSQAKENNDA